MLVVSARSFNKIAYKTSKASINNELTEFKIDHISSIFNYDTIWTRLHSKQV